MNFVAQVEEQLRDLGTEARRKHPGVKEASERAILQLRTLQNKYALAVRRATKQQNYAHPTTAIFQSQDILRPFLLAANYPDAGFKLVALALNAVQLLVGGDAICSEDGIHVVRVLSIQANVCAMNLHGPVGISSGGSNAGGVAGRRNSTVSGSTSAGGSSNGQGQNVNTNTISSLGSSIMTGFTGMLGSGGGGGKQHHEGGSIIGGYSSSAGSGNARSVKEDEAVSIRILQTLTMIVNARGLDLTEEILSQCISICLVLISSSSGSCDDMMMGGESTFSLSHKKLIKSQNGGVMGMGKAGILLERGSSGGSSSGGASVKKVRRAAAATLRQIIAIVFDRATSAVITPNGDDENGEEKSGLVEEKNVDIDKQRKYIQKLASHTLMDLCIFAEYRDSDHDHPPIRRHSHAGTEKKQDGEIASSKVVASGPIAQALTGGGGGMGHHVHLDPLPRTACFDLLDMILQQHLELFTFVPQKPIGDKSNDDDDDEEEEEEEDDLPDFPSILRDRICPLISNTLTSEFVIGLNKRKGSYEEPPSSSKDNSGLKRASSSDDSSAAFSLLLILTQLSSTIIALYGNKANMQEECHVLLVCLVKFIKAATELFRDSNDTEDGYIYHGLVDEFHENNTSSSNANSRRLTQKQKDSGTYYTSSLVMWRASIALEFFSILITDHFETLLTFNSEKSSTNSLVTLMAEAVSEFAIVASSNKVRIERVVSVSALATPDSMFNFSPVLRKDDDTRKEATINDGSENNPTIESNQFLPQCDVGEAAWIAFNFIVSFWDSILPFHVSKDSIGENEPKQNDSVSVLVDSAFNPSIAVLQHFLRRFPGSKAVVHRVLCGYIYLANNAFPICKNDDMRRKATLTSLCRLAFPYWGKKEFSGQLHDHHIASLAALLQIIHSNYEYIDHDWQIVLYTFEQLSSVLIASPLLTSDGYQAANSIATSITRIGAFSSCMSVGSMKVFVSALISNSKRHPPSSTGETIEDEGDEEDVGSDTDDSELGLDEKESLGGKIFSFAGRALTGGLGVNGNQDLEMPGHDEISSTITSTKLYGDNFRDSVFAKLVPTKPNTTKNDFHDIPFTLVLLIDLVIENSFRFDAFNEEVTSFICELAAKSQTPEIRVFAMDAIANFVTTGLAGDTTSRTMESQHNSIISKPKSIDECLKINKDEHETPSVAPDQMPQQYILDPLCKTIATTKMKDTAESGLKTLHAILEGAGHNLTGEAWLTIIGAISALSGCQTDSESQFRSNSEWATSCTLAFRCLKLIVDDFLDELPEVIDSSLTSTRLALLDCCVSFGSSQHDVNVSLTATGMLWTIADQAATLSSVDDVLPRLALLAIDGRTEVRNCSANTLFSCVVGLGNNFSGDQWRSCFCETIFTVLDEIIPKVLGEETAAKTKPDNENESTSSDRYKVSVHHSRDSSSKQWSTTLVLMLQGIERVFRQYFDKLLSISIPLDGQEQEQHQWFESIWSRILQLALKCSTQVGGRETLDVRLAGVEMLILCAQVSSTSGIMAISNPARVGTNMQVVNGALRTVRSANVSTPQKSTRFFADNSELESLMNKKKVKLFEESFEVLERFRIYINGDILDEESSGTSMYMETTAVQVMTKFCQLLTKLYECTKDKELRPSLSLGANDNDMEISFVSILGIVMDKTAGAPGSKYLTQGQRASVDLLQSMASHSSSQALVQLAKVGGHAFFWDENTDANTNNFDLELVNHEAASAVSELCSQTSMEDVPKIRALNVIIELFSNHHDETKRSSAESTANYKMIVPIIISGLEALHKLDTSEEKVDSDEEVLDKVKNGIIQFLSLLLSTTEHREKHFAANAKEINEILSASVKVLHTTKSQQFDDVLSAGVKETISLAKVLPSSSNEVVGIVLQIFSECFTITYQTPDRREFLCTVVAQSFDDAIQIINGTVPSDNIEVTENSINIATILCNMLCAVPNINDLAIKLFPLLCKLMVSEEVNLRQGASNLLQKIDIGGVVERSGKVESQDEDVDRLESQIEDLSEQLKFEKERVRAAEAREQETKKLYKEQSVHVDKLERQKERLEQQVAVLSEGSSYT